VAREFLLRVTLVDKLGVTGSLGIEGVDYNLNEGAVLVSAKRTRMIGRLGLGLGQRP
jgi:hypothetical protein